MSWTEADLAVPRMRVIRTIRRRRIAARLAAVAAVLIAVVILWPRTEVQTLALKPAAPPVVEVVQPRYAPAIAHPPRSQEKQQVVVKMLTDDPNIVIYWVTD